MAAPSRALEKAKGLLSTDFYEAQQLFKTVYHRQRTKKQLQDSYATLKEGAVLQLQAGHTTCGVELGLLLIDALTTDGVTPDMAAMQSLLDIIAAMPAGADSGAGGAGPQSDDVEECARLVSAIVSWANKQPQVSWQAVQRVHAAFASHLWRRYHAGQLQRVALHAVRSGQPTLHAQVLSEVCPVGAQDVFWTQAVLQVLAIARPHTKAAQLEHAKGLLAALTTAPPTANGGSSGQPPLINFLGLLTEALERQSLPLVRLLRDRYAPALSADPAWSEYLSRIEAAYLGVRDQGGAGGLGGLLGQLMQGMGGMGGAAGVEGEGLTGFDEEESEEGNEEVYGDGGPGHVPEMPPAQAKKV